MGIMSRILRIADIISTDVRSRSRADIIRNELEENRSNLILDFTDVVFMSRSFTDELYAIKSDYPDLDIQLIGMTGVVKAMSDAVSASRGKKRIRKEQDAVIKECKDEASLMEYFLALKNKFKVG